MPNDRDVPMPEVSMPAPVAGGPRPFMDFLREHRAGQTHDELSAAMQDAVAAVEETNKPAEVILKIKIKPLDNKTGGAVVVYDEIVTKLPKPQRDGSVFFVTPENNLSKHDAPQRRLELRDLDSQTPRVVREIG